MTDPTRPSRRLRVALTGLALAGLVGAVHLSTAARPGSASLSSGSLQLTQLRLSPGSASLSSTPGSASLSSKPGSASLSSKPGSASLSSTPGSASLSSTPGSASLS